MVIRLLTLLTALLTGVVLVGPTPVAAQTMVGYGLATARSASASGGLKKVGQGVAGSLSRNSGALGGAAGTRQLGAPTKPTPSPNALQVQGASREPLARVVYATWGEDASGVPAPERSSSVIRVAGSTDPAASAIPAAPGPDPASEALSRVQVGMPVSEALELLGKPTMAFLGVSGAGYNAKYVFQVADKRVIALALDGVVTRIQAP